MKAVTLVLALAGAIQLPSLASGRATLADNGYTGLVVAISPDVPQDNKIIDNIKEILTSASAKLFSATRNRAFFKEVTILLPKTWDYVADPIEDESYETAEYRIDIPNPVYGEGPFTQQTIECGVEGSHTHLTPSFVLEPSQWGDKGKVLVHEWAKLRWGVYEEHGYPGDDKFPMFYLKKTFTIDGESTKVQVNLCLNSDAIGEEQDITTGGRCTTDTDGLPNGNCYYYVSQNTKATTSYMAVPYLNSIETFCDDGETFYHDAGLPNKQNLMCDGRSTWDVITSSKDFAGNANPPVANSTDTTPKFVIKGGAESSTTSYVLVMDVSTSMEEFNRLQPLKDAAKRWIKYDVENGVDLGMVIFADEEWVRPIQNLTTVSDTNREGMIDVVDKIKATGKTCIGCGLRFAKDYAGLLKGKNGNVIILITDGKQECLHPTKPECVTISDVKDDLVARKIRVITIAFGNEADPEIEDLALATGGKSYFVDDTAGSGTINGAFTGSTTYQPGDTLGNKSITVYQKDWTADEVAGAGNKGLVGYYDLDASVGRDVEFQLDVRADGDTCTKAVDIVLIAPDAEHTATNMNFTCNPTNFGVFRKTTQGQSLEGRWIYKVVPKESYKSVSVTIQAKARSETSPDPIESRCWISTGDQDLNSGKPVKLSVIAEVKQSNKPVLGAKVEALVERPPLDDGTPQDSLWIELFDNGAGSDLIKNDGLYSRYFSKYTGKGRYSVKCQVVGDNSTQINEGFITSRALPMNFSTPMCCGSDTVFANSKLSNTGNFTRQASGGSFQITTNVSLVDNFPPSRVIDLQATSTGCDDPIVLRFTAPGDDLDSDDPVAAYDLRFAATPGNLTKFDNGTNHALQASHLAAGSSSLVPVNGTQQVELTLSNEAFGPNILYYFAMRPVDENNNTSPVSNVVSAMRVCSTSAAHPTAPSTSMAAIFTIVMSFAHFLFMLRTD